MNPTTSYTRATAAEADDGVLLVETTGAPPSTAEEETGVMQTVLDSLCRCFGSPVSAADLDSMSTPTDTHGQAQHQQTRRSTSTGSVPATPDMKRRTNRLKLQDEQWDALFMDCNSNRRRSASPPTQPADKMTLEQAQAVAKVKLAANGNSYKAQKRKRTTADDIFRSKKSATSNGSPRGGEPANGGSGNPFSRFLSNNPVIANSLCFATPVRDSADEEGPDRDSNSVVSESNTTLNTAEDTMTSTIYYEQVKLAGLTQKNPPMPLFNAYELKAGDDIHKIVASDSHSSVMMKDWVRQNAQVLLQQKQQGMAPNTKASRPRNVSPHNKTYNAQVTPPTTPRQPYDLEDPLPETPRGGSTSATRKGVDESPPPVTDCSSDSTNARSV